MPQSIRFFVYTLHVWVCSEYTHPSDVCMYTCMYVCVYNMYVCMHGCMHGWMYAWMDVCMHACISVCMYVLRTCKYTVSISTRPFFTGCPLLRGESKCVTIHLSLYVVYSTCIMCISAHILRGVRIYLSKHLPLHCPTYNRTATRIFQVRKGYEQDP